jgi:hypothetical protein
MMSHVHWHLSVHPWNRRGSDNDRDAGFTVSGLGNLPLTETLVVTASYAATCVNHGGNVAPGIKTVQVASPPVTQGPISAHNGTFTFGSLSYTLVAPNPANYSATAYCPNGNWTISSFTLTATSGTLTLSNQNGVLYGPIALS